MDAVAGHEDRIVAQNVEIAVQAGEDGLSAACQTLAVVDACRAILWSRVCRDLGRLVPSQWAA